MNSLTPKNLGICGEKIAKNFLEQKGYKILDTNFTTKWGELDIVAKKNKVLIFGEVKTIFKNPGFSPEDEISPKKEKQLRKMFQIYLSSKKLPSDTACQIDIIAIEKEGEKTVVRHYENAVEDSY